MRITQGMLSSNMLNNLMKSQSQMDKYLEQLYTGKKINRPSDDPVVAMKGMGYRTELSEIEQFKRNTGEVHNWMDNSDASLDKATKAMQRMEELAVQASNAGTQTPEDLKSIAEEVKQLKEHLIDIANTQVNGKYIFNGTDTDKALIKFATAEDVLEAKEADPSSNLEVGDRLIGHNNNPILIEVSSGTKLQANVDATKVFSETLFEDIDKFIAKLDPKDGAPVDPESMDASIKSLNGNINNIVDARAELGARMNRLELVENRLDEQKVVATKTMSDNENVHFEEAITNLITQESLHRAALSAGSRIIQPSLLDFLR